MMKVLFSMMVDIRKEERAKVGWDPLWPHTWYLQGSV
jgi:hypothetical protein